MNIDESVCWLCGQKFNGTVQKTKHHVIPRCLEPIKNLTIPLCRGCHDTIHEVDFSTMLPYVYKLNANAISLTERTEQVLKSLERTVDMQDKLSKALE